MNKKLILITTIAIVVYLISLNYETIKTKLLNFIVEIINETEIKSNECVFKIIKLKLVHYNLLSFH